ncbi:MAG: EutN/CcmL family microcompartment protein [Candidatus Sumerlaeia bacterium]|nr:EutN/CcmL family microcompartment protein [Candidatus Sumerlaeia bacterium]
MDLARVIGAVTATRKEPSLTGLKLCVIQPLDADLQPVREPLIATDATGKRGDGELVYFVESGDAVPTGLGADPNLPVDAAVVGIVDDVDVRMRL